MDMDLSFYTSPMSEEIRDEGRAEGQAKSLLRMLELRAITISDETREKITGCNDLQLLDQRFSRAVTATTTDEIFAEE